MSDNLETFSLLWLDAAVNTSRENIEAQPRLRAIINHLKTFESVHKCEKYIQKCFEDRIVLIVSGGLGQEIVPGIVTLKQVSSIYVYCMDKKKNSKWANQYKKVKQLITNLDDLIRQIEIDQAKKKKKIEEQFTINFLEADTMTERASIGLNGQFLHSQLLIDCLLRMDPIPENKDKLISLCKKKYKGNNKEMDIVHDFKTNYTSKKALLWYTRESFLYRMLNKALRVQNVELLCLFQFFIRDLRSQIEENRCSSRVHTYRCQSISKEELKGLTNSIGKLISMSSFVSTSLNRHKALSFLDVTDDFQPVLFEIDADPRPGVKPFANIASHAAYPGEMEVLIMLGSIFRVIDVSRGGGQIWNIRMMLCSDSDHDNNLRAVFRHMQMENIISHGQSRLSFGIILHKMDKLDDANKYLTRLLDELPRDHKDVAGCYFILGNIALDKGDCESSLNWHHKSLEIKMRTLKSDDPDLADSHNCIGNVYASRNDHQRALKSYKNAMLIWQRKFGDEHPTVAMCLNNMGNVLDKEKQYVNALECHRKALAIRTKCLPLNHPDLGTSHNNLGLAYKCIGHLGEALEHFNQSLNIKQKSLPPQHQSIAATLENLGSVYAQTGALPQALMCYRKAAEGYRHTYNSQHEKVVHIEKEIRRLESQLK